MSAAEVIKPGRFDLSSWGAVSIQGPDAADYLNRMSTVALKNFGVGQVAHGAFLTGRGLVVGLGMLERVATDAFHFWCSAGQAEKVAAHLEQFHFAEKLTVQDISAEYRLVGFWREEPFAGIAEMRTSVGKWNDVSMTAWREDVRPSFIWGKIKRSEKLPDVWLPQSDYDFLRIAAGIPQVGAEVSDHEIVLETSFDRAVARNKGCYPGQEVVERIFTYGSVNRKLVRVEWSGTVPALPAEVKVDGKPAGKWVSAAATPGKTEAGVGLSYIQKAFWGYEGKADAGSATLHWKLDAEKESSL